MLLRILPLLLLAGPPLFAQAPVVVVDANGGAGSSFTQIQPAVDAAAPGTTILIRTGSYLGFTIDAKPLSVGGDLNAVVDVFSTVRILNLAEGQDVLLRNLRVTETGIPEILLVSNCVGSVWIEDSAFRGLPFNHFGHVDGARVQSSDSVLFVRTELHASKVSGTGDGHGLQILASTVHMFDCDVRGGDGTRAVFASSPGEKGHAAIQMLGGFLFATGTSVSGGEGGSGATASIWEPGCSDGGAGGTGLEMASGTPTALLQDCVVTAGAGGPGGIPSSGPPCNAGAPGTAFDTGSGTLQTIGGAHRTCAATTPHRSGETLSLQLAGAPGDLVWLLLSGSFDPSYQPLLFGSSIAAGPPFVFGAGILPGSGSKILSIPIQVSPQAQSLVVYLQSLVYGIQEASFLLGSPSAAVLLSSGF